MAALVISNEVYSPTLQTTKKWGNKKIPYVTPDQHQQSRILL